MSICVSKIEFEINKRR